MSKIDINDKKAYGEIIELNALESKFKKIKSKYEIKKKKLVTSIKNYMYSNGKDEVSFDVDNSIEKLSINVKKITPQKILWDIDKIEQKVDKEICNEIINKKYTINDMQGLTRYLKSCGVNPKKFKQFICVEKSVNVSALDLLYETGDIEKESLNGCYTVNKSASYLKIKVDNSES